MGCKGSSEQRTRTGGESESSDAGQRVQARCVAAKRRIGRFQAASRRLDRTHQERREAFSEGRVFSPKRRGCPSTQSSAGSTAAEVPEEEDCELALPEGDDWQKVEDGPDPSASDCGSGGTYELTSSESSEQSRLGGSGKPLLFDAQQREAEAGSGSRPLLRIKSIRLKDTKPETLFWSKQHWLYFHPRSGWFFDPATELWFDPDADCWRDADHNPLTEEPDGGQANTCKPGVEATEPRSGEVSLASKDVGGRSANAANPMRIQPYFATTTTKE